MKILGIIPARGGSKGVPGKNIKLLGGKPLIEYTIRSAKESRFLTEIMVSTDSAEIRDVAIAAGATVPFLRPSDLATDSAGSLSVVAHAVGFYEQQGISFDAICLLQPTTPFRRPGFIDDAISKFIQSNTDSLVSVLVVPHQYNPHWTFTDSGAGVLQIATGDKTIVARRQDLPTAYYRDGSIYITKTDTIKSGSLYGSSISYITNDPLSHVNIDTLDDWQMAENMLQRM